MESFALHEAGHALGLEHSSVGLKNPDGTSNSDDKIFTVMFPSQSIAAPRHALTADDRQAVGSLYDVWKSISGLATDIGVGGSASAPVVWVTSGSNTIWKFNFSSQVFEQDLAANANGVAIAVDAAGVPCVATSANRISCRSNSGRTATGTWTDKDAGRDLQRHSSEERMGAARRCGGEDRRSRRWTAVGGPVHRPHLPSQHALRRSDIRVRRGARGNLLFSTAARQRTRSSPHATNLLPYCCAR
jgi:hypothetical protein